MDAGRGDDGRAGRARAPARAGAAGGRGAGAGCLVARVGSAEQRQRILPEVAGGAKLLRSPCEPGIRWPSTESRLRRCGRVIRGC